MSARTAPRDLLELPGLVADYPMARLTSLAVGGPADFFLETDRTEVLAQALGAAAGHMPVVAVGRGTNLVVADEGVAGLVIRWRGREVSFQDGTGVRVGAGMEHGRLARLAARQGLAGLEFAAGIPGTVGGASWNNAGAFGSDFQAVIRTVTAVAEDGSLHRHGLGECGYGYRTSAFRRGEIPRCVITEVELELRAGEAAQVEAEINSVVRRRKSSQPVKNRSVGSIFKNPTGDFAARLIDQAGLKGLRRGEAEVSPEHANFIVNRGAATAAQIRGLIEEVRDRVRTAHGVELEPEIEFMGRWQ